MHIGIHTSWEILQGKLEVRDEPQRTSETWQLSRLPQKLSKEGPNYLFVATGGFWQGYFTLEGEFLWNPEDKRCPFSLIFDTRSWVAIKPITAKRFRGFTYDTPRLEDIEPLA